MNTKLPAIFALLAMTTPILASSPGTLHAKCFFADSPAHLKQAIDLLLDQDWQSLAQMVLDDTAVPTAKALKIQIDQVNVWEGWIKWHLKGHAELESYSSLTDVDIDKPQ